MKGRLESRGRHRTAHGGRQGRKAVSVQRRHRRYDESRLPSGNLQAIRGGMHGVRKAHATVLCFECETSPLVKRRCAPSVNRMNGGRRDGGRWNEARRRTVVATVAGHVEPVATEHRHHRRRVGRHARSAAATGGCHAGRARHACSPRQRLAGRHRRRGRVREPVTSKHLLGLLDPFSTFVGFSRVDNLVRCATNALRHAVRARHVWVLANEDMQGSLGATVLGSEESEHVASEDVVSNGTCRLLTRGRKTYLTRRSRQESHATF